MKDSDKQCRHIKKVKDQFCDWHGEYGMKVQTDYQEENQICPKCGGKTEIVRMLV